MNDSPGSVELLTTRVDELEKRVYALEHPDEVTRTLVPASAKPAPPALSREEASLEAANLFPTLGRAMLGIAGAYLLRALASTDAAPKLAVAALAILYAFAWLIWAARISNSNRLSSTIYAATSALIFVPMLWETTLHFRTFSPIATACVLAAFAMLAAVATWRNGSQPALWVSYIATAISAVALSVATHQLLPFLYVLLLIALACEVPRMLGRPRPMWWLVAFAADAAIWVMVFIYAGPADARSEYPHLTSATLVLPLILLFVIYATSLSVRAILRERTLSIFEAIQAIIAFLLAVSGVFYLAPQTGTPAVGIPCLILSVAGYVASFRYLRPLAAPRNFRIFGIWSAALFAAGIIWTLPHAASILFAISALAAYTIGARIDCLTLELHAALFIVLATAISDLPRFIFSELAGATPNAPTLQVFVIVLCVTAAFAVSSDSPSGKWSRQVFCFIPALVAAFGLAALLVCGMLSIARLAVSLDVHHIAFLRTLVLSATATCLAFAGSRWGRQAMTRLAYIALVFLAAKLLIEDLRHGHMEFIAASIFLFAITLIAVPRFVRSGNRLREAATKEAQTGRERPTTVA